MDDLGLRIKSFALNPAKDLIVLLEHRPPIGPIAASASSSPDPAAGANIRVHLQRLRVCQRAASAVRGHMIQIVEDVTGNVISEPSSPKRPAHVATLHLPLLHDYRVLLELTTMTGPHSSPGHLRA